MTHESDLTLALLRECQEFEDANLPVCYEERRRSRAKAPRKSRMRKSGNRFFALILLSLFDERRIQISDGITS
ncbi:hypothetical protein [Bosea sp. 685]|uniref:hypothetical protein n=1 Tax=Bosea sp. 685 TaxID=3080057 RepID=UPI0028933895|nr:hypothetical protein [Bosea sp. 685]WNJ92007.1 hypothetical protein RMR04_06795 [Bosea sp. 685]